MTRPTRRAEETFRCMVDEELRGDTLGQNFGFDRFGNCEKWLLVGEHPLFKYATAKTFTMYGRELCYRPSEEPGDPGIEQKLEGMAIKKNESEPTAT